MRLFRDIICVVVGIVLVIGASLIYNANIEPEKPHQCEPFDIYQLQTFLSERTDPTTGKPYYTGKIDGICYDLTHGARDRFCADRFAAKYMTPSGAPNDSTPE